MQFFKIDGRSFELERFQGRFHLYYKGNKIAELINGQEGLDRYHKGKFELWIAKIKKRDLQRIENIEYQIDYLKYEMNNLNNRWGNTIDEKTKKEIR